MGCCTLPPLLQFPVNYFTISEVEQWWPEDFVAAFELAAGRALSKQVRDQGPNMQCCEFMHLSFSPCT
jgi:hypothetical protein